MTGASEQNPNAGRRRGAARLRALLCSALGILLLSFAPLSGADHKVDEGDFNRMLHSYLLAETGSYAQAAAILIRLGVEYRDPQMLRDATDYAFRSDDMRTALKASREWAEVEDTALSSRMVAIALLRLSETESAIDVLSRSVRLFDLPPQGYLEIAGHALGEDPLHVAAQMERIYPASRQGADYHSSLSEFHEKRGDDARALAEAETAVRISRSPEREQRHVRLQLRAGENYEGAVETLRRLAQERQVTSQEAYSWLALVQLSAAAPIGYRMMAEVYGVDGAPAEDLYYVARMGLFANEHAAARQYAQAAVERHHGYIPAQFLLVFMNEHDDDPGAALAALDRIAAERGDPAEETATAYSYYRSSLTEQSGSRPNSSIPPTALRNYRAGTVFEDMGDPNRAMRTFARVRESDGHLHFYAQSSLARLQLSAGDRDRAFTTVHRLHAVYTDPDRRFIFNRDMATEAILSEAELIKMDQGLAEAIRFLEQALDADIDILPLLYQVAIYAEELEDLARAEQALRRSLSLEVGDMSGLDHFDAFNALGYLLADKNLKLEEAHGLIQRALEARPNDPNIIDSLGWVQYRQGKLGLALDTLIKAATHSMAAEIHAHLGEVYWTLGDRSSANAIWDRALYLHPDNEILLETIERLRAL